MSYIKRKSARQESRTAKEFGGKTTMASGALWTQKADVRTDEFLIENKYTEKEFYSLTFSVWDKIQKEALRDNCRTGIMQIDVRDTQLVVLDYNDFIELFEEYNFELPGTTNTSRSYRIGSDYMRPYYIHLLSINKDLEATTLMKVVVIDKDTFLSR